MTRLIDADALGDITVTIDGTVFVRYEDIMNEPTIEIDQIVYDYLIKNNITEIQNHRTGLVFQLIRHGRWVSQKEEGWAGGGVTRCSRCNFGYAWGAFHEVEEFNFCPNCGARMESE